MVGRCSITSFSVGDSFACKLVGNGFGDLALDGKHVGQIAIIGLRPKMRVIAGVD